MLKLILASALALGAAPAALGQAAEPVSAAKKELVAKVLKLQQSGIENLGRTLAEQPVQMVVAQVRTMLARLPQDKRDALAREIEADVRKYVEDAVPVVRDRAVALAPATLSPLLEQRFSEDELRQIIAMLESPVNAKYQSMAGEMQRTLGTKVVAETRATIEPRFKALEESVNKRLRAALPAGN